MNAVDYPKYPDRCYECGEPISEAEASRYGGACSWCWLQNDAPYDEEECEDDDAEDD